MTLILVSFGVVFLLVASGGLLLFYREAMMQRLSAVMNPQPKKTDLIGTLHQTGASLGEFVERFDRVLPKSEHEKSVQAKRLVRAGYRSDSAIRIFYGAKVVVPAFFCMLAFTSGFMSAQPFMAWTLSLGLGFLLPDFWLGRRIKLRQKKIRLGLPDVLDFLVICVEAGLSLDQATARTADELKLARPEIADELDIVVLEVRAGRPRSDAWKQFADRTDVDSIRVLCTILVQAEQLGTSVSKTLRVHSETLRTKRRQQVEEQAAKTTVKLVFPLVFFIFPSLFVVVLAPSVIIMSESFKVLTH